MQFAEIVLNLFDTLAASQLISQLAIIRDHFKKIYKQEGIAGVVM